MEQIARQGALGQTRPLAWNLYFDEKDFDAQDRRAQLIQELAAFFSAVEGWTLLHVAASWFDRVVIEIPWTELAQLCKSQDLFEALQHAPTEALSCIAAAAFEVCQLSVLSTARSTAVPSL